MSSRITNESSDGMMSVVGDQTRLKARMHMIVFAQLSYFEYDISAVFLHYEVLVFEGVRIG